MTIPKDRGNNYNIQFTDEETEYLRGDWLA